jgi:transglutaminase-like putative cysteine protease
MSIPDGPAGIKETLEAMRQLVYDGKVRPYIRIFAARLVHHLPSKDARGEIFACWRFVKNNIRFLSDIHDVETLQTPVNTLIWRYGDCDDHAVLLASLLGAIGYRTRFVAVGFQPNVYVHVYCEAEFSPNAWIALETTEDVPIGWRPPGVIAQMRVEN